MEFCMSVYNYAIITPSGLSILPREAQMLSAGQYGKLLLVLSAEDNCNNRKCLFLARL